MTTVTPAANTPDRRGNRLSRWWRRRGAFAKTLLLLPLIGFFLLLVALGGVVFAASRVRVPGPEEVNNKDQTTIVYYADGKTELGRLSGEVNRVSVPLAQIPKHVQDAVLAAEDRDFYRHSGVSVRGTARALIRDVRGGGARQGGSTIVQQYAKNAFLGNKKTLGRKFEEAVIAVKLDRKYSKQTILENYLNTIYWGRGAYGVEAAARTYFNKPAKALSLEEGAFLAGIIQAPAAYDPDDRESAAGAEIRFRYVLDGMVRTGALTPDKVADARLPKVKKRTPGGVTGPNTYVILKVRKELAAQDFADKDVYSGGLRIVTTIDKKAQDAALAAIKEFFPPGKTPKDLQQALVAVDAKTGAIRAMYGGPGPRPDEKLIDYSGVVGSTKRQPGSSFKPYVLAAALEDGWSLRSLLDGDSPSKPYPGKPDGFRNFDRHDYGTVDLVTATARSVNTAYAELGNTVGLGKVTEAARKAGLSATDAFGRNSSMPLGAVEVSVADQASGFATFANNGESTRRFIVAAVRSSDGKSRYKAKTRKTRAFDGDVAADASFAMQAVLKDGGTAPESALDSRPAAGKTGTTSENADAWFVGYTPQLSTAVWIGFPDRNKKLQNIEVGGVALTEVTGGRGSAKIWKAFMDAALDGVKVEEFPPPAFGGKAMNLPPPPPPPPPPTPTASARATPTPSKTIKPTPTPTPTPTASARATPTPSKTIKPTPTPRRTIEPTPEPGKGKGKGRRRPPPIPLL